MWFTRQDSGFRGWFIVKKGNGTLYEDLLSSSFVATVRNPQDITGSIFEVTQSGKQGLYRFDVPTSFLATSGLGEYGVVVEVAAISPKVNDAMSEVLRINQNDIDSLTSSIWDEPNNLHFISGSTGDSLFSASVASVGDVSASVDVNSIVDGVWNASASPFNTIGTMGELQNLTATIDANLLIVSGAVGLISGCVDFIKDIEGGRWKIDTALNQMVFYKEDNVTEVARFDLFDAAGSPTSDSPFERTRS